MVYAVLCIACHAIVSREARQALLGGRAIFAGLIAIALFSPNIVWNAEHGWPTAKHTGDNISWRAPYIHPLALAEFIAAQFALFGPILFAVFARASFRHAGRPDDTNKTLLLCFSLPILATLAVQALLSRAHGNWAATAYPAASVFVSAVMLEQGRRVLMAISMALHFLVAAIIGIAPAFARSWTPFEQLQFLRSSIGWDETADAVRKLLSEGAYGAVLVDTRDMTAELLYYMGEAKTPIYVWKRRPEATPSLRDDPPLRGRHTRAGSAGLSARLPQRHCAPFRQRDIAAASRNPIGAKPNADAPRLRAIRLPWRGQISADSAQ